MADYANSAGGLPWGWHLRARVDALEDDDGRTWDSVRQAFWEGRMGFPSVHFVLEQEELLLRVLTGIDRRFLDGAEFRHDLFGGDMLFWRFYQSWLASTGLLERSSHRHSLEAPLSAEGRSVMLMLQATREPSWEALPMADVIEAVWAARSDGVDAAREASLEILEREVARRRHVFARERLGVSRLITLTGIGVGARMPVRRVIWSHSFRDEDARDDFFAWLAQRVDRWDDWGELAYAEGAAALTRRFLTLMMEGRRLSSYPSGAVG